MTGRRDAEIVSLLRGSGCGRVAERFVESLVPGVMLLPRRVERDEAIAVGAGKFGGGADLRRGVEWPRHEGVDQRLLAQINLGEVAAMWPEAPLPKSGVLSFFFCLEADAWSDPRRWGWRVEYAPASAEVVRVPDPWAAREPRVGLVGRVLGRKPSPHGRGFSPCAVEMRRVWCVPSFTPDEGMQLNNEEFEQIHGKLAGRLLELDVMVGEGHRLLGAACPVQQAVEVEAAAYADGGGSGRVDWDQAARRAGEWRLLLQVDSDSVPEFMFGDMGSLYFMMRERDLREARWDRVWVVAQCC